MRHATMRVRAEEPDFSAVLEDSYTWYMIIYGNVKTELPKDIPKLLGKSVRTTHYVDAHLHYYIIPGRSATGILYLVNNIPIK